MAPTPETPITVKLVLRRPRYYPPEMWLRQFPGRQPVWGRCRFVFDPDERRYDWLAVYDDLPPDRDGGSHKGHEELACPKDHTILVTTEPRSIKRYGRRFVSQFGHVLTSQEPEALQHPRAIRSQPALRWYYGVGSSHLITFDDMVRRPPLAKSRLISTVASSKKQWHTLHRRRFLFTRELKSLLPELEVFGHGVRDMDDKAEALDLYRYHVAVENHVGLHHWTEKLADAFLGCCLPFYFGAPNAAEYFPADSYIPIDIFDPEAAARVIRATIRNSEYDKRLPHILEARRRVLYECNIFPILARLIEARHSAAVRTPGLTLFSRHALRFASPLHALQDLFDKARGRLSWPKGAR